MEAVVDTEEVQVSATRSALPEVAPTAVAKAGPEVTPPVAPRATRDPRPSPEVQVYKQLQGVKESKSNRELDLVSFAGYSA